MSKDVYVFTNNSFLSAGSQLYGTNICISSSENLAIVMKLIMLCSTSPKGPFRSFTPSPNILLLRIFNACLPTQHVQISSRMSPISMLKSGVSSCLYAWLMKLHCNMLDTPFCEISAVKYSISPSTIASSSSFNSAFTCLLACSILNLSSELLSAGLEAGFSAMRRWP